MVTIETKGVNISGSSGGVAVSSSKSGGAEFSIGGSSGGWAIEGGKSGGYSIETSSKSAKTGGLSADVHIGGGGISIEKSSKSGSKGISIEKSGSKGISIEKSSKSSGGIKHSHSGNLHIGGGDIHTSHGGYHSSSSHHGGSASYSIEYTHEDNSQLIKDLWIFHDDVTLGLKRIIETITSRDKIVVRLMREAKEREHAILEWKKKWESANHLVMERQAKIHELEERLRKLMIEYQQIEHLKAALAAKERELAEERKRWHLHIEELKATIHKRDVYIEELRKNQCSDECRKLKSKMYCLEENIKRASQHLYTDHYNCDLCKKDSSHEKTHKMKAAVVNTAKYSSGCDCDICRGGSSSYYVSKSSSSGGKIKAASSALTSSAKYVSDHDDCDICRAAAAGKSSYSYSEKIVKSK